MIKSANWLNRPLFVSSTFNDMHAERDYLQQFVFPEIAEKLRDHQYHLEVLDFRWGIDTTGLADQQAKELTVLKVCLAEIDRSRPFMIILLGDRYGWTPGEERIQSAASEVQLKMKQADCSVTALEIEYGIFQDKDAGRRSFFYLREPLPYNQMDAATIGKYSDHLNNPASYRALQELKKRLQENYPGQVRPYTADWDEHARLVTGLKNFGDLVKADLWNAISEALNLQNSTALQWQAEEQQLLESFTETHCRNFSGRQEILNHLQNALTDTNTPAMAPLVMLQGASGSGKTAVFSKLYRQMQQQEGGIVIAHSAGVSSLSTQVNRMLQKFCFQLSGFLQIEDESEKQAGYEALKNYFHALLQQATAVSRVTLMIDAADQFERTPAAKYLTWLPALMQWPNQLFVFITTGLDSTEADVVKSANSNYLLLPAFSPAEASLLATTICSHYHKTLPEQVKSALLARQAADGTPASGNPLWLTLMVNELLVLDAADFSRTSQFTGNAEQQLQQLLVQVVQDIPAEALGAIDYLLNRVEETYGKIFTGNTLLFIAIARDGLRESDLGKLYNTVTGEPWQSTTFAVIRRSMRMLLRQQGETGKWVFTHRLLYEAAGKRYFPSLNERKNKHRQLADYLSALPDNDDMKDALLHHLLHADDFDGTYNHIIKGRPESLKKSDNYTFSGFLKAQDADVAGQWLVRLINSPFKEDELKPEHQWGMFYVITQMMMEFMESMRFENGPEFSLQLIVQLTETLEKHLEKNPADNMARENLYRFLQMTAQFQNISGKEDLSLQNSIRAAGINEQFVKQWGLALDQDDGIEKNQTEFKRIQYHTSKHSLMLNHINIAEHYQRKGDHKQTLEWLLKALEISGWLLNIYPNSNLGKLDMANNHVKIASVLMDDGQTEKAVIHSQEAVSLAESLMKAAPQDKKHALLLVESYRNMARLQVLLFDHGMAEKYFSAAYGLCKKIKDLDPGDLLVQWKTVILLEQMGDFYLDLKNVNQAENCFGESIQNLGFMVSLGANREMIGSHMQYGFRKSAAIKLLQGDQELAAKYLHYADTV